MQTGLPNTQQNEDNILFNIAVVVTCPNVNIPPTRVLLDEILKKMEELKIRIMEESIFLVHSLREAPLLVQSISESMIYDGMLVIDIINPSDNMTKLLLPSITSAIYQAELDNGMAVYQAIYFQADLSRSDSGMAQLAESILKQLNFYISQNMIIRMNGVEYSEELDDDKDNPF